MSAELAIGLGSLISAVLLAVGTLVSQKRSADREKEKSAVTMYSQVAREWQDLATDLREQLAAVQAEVERQNRELERLRLLIQFHGIDLNGPVR